MPQEHTQRFCPRCQQPRLFTRNGTNHLVHAIVTLFLCGLWIPVWIIVAIAADPFRCSSCGEK